MLQSPASLFLLSDAGIRWIANGKCDEHTRLRDEELALTLTWRVSYMVNLSTILLSDDTIHLVNLFSLAVVHGSSELSTTWMQEETGNI